MVEPNLWRWLWGDAESTISPDCHNLIKGTFPLLPTFVSIDFVSGEQQAPIHLIITVTGTMKIHLILFDAGSSISSLN